MFIKYSLVVFHIPVVYQIELDLLFSIAFCIFSIAINANHIIVYIYIYTHTSDILNYFLCFCQYLLYSVSSTGKCCFKNCINFLETRSLEILQNSRIFTGNIA